MSENNLQKIAEYCVGAEKLFSKKAYGPGYDVPNRPPRRPTDPGQPIIRDELDATPRPSDSYLEDAERLLAQSNPAPRVDPYTPEVQYGTHGRRQIPTADRSEEWSRSFAGTLPSTDTQTDLGWWQNRIHQLAQEYHQAANIADRDLPTRQRLAGIINNYEQAVNNYRQLAGWGGSPENTAMRADPKLNQAFMDAYSPRQGRRSSYIPSNIGQLPLDEQRRLLAPRPDAELEKTLAMGDMEQLQQLLSDPRYKQRFANAPLLTTQFRDADLIERIQQNRGYTPADISNISLIRDELRGRGLTNRQGFLALVNSIRQQFPNVQNPVAVAERLFTSNIKIPDTMIIPGARRAVSTEPESLPRRITSAPRRWWRGGAQDALHTTITQPILDLLDGLWNRDDPHASLRPQANSIANTNNTIDRILNGASSIGVKNAQYPTVCKNAGLPALLIPAAPYLAGGLKALGYGALAYGGYRALTGDSETPDAAVSPNNPDDPSLINMVEPEIAPDNAPSDMEDAALVSAVGTMPYTAHSSPEDLDQLSRQRWGDFRRTLPAQSPYTMSPEERQQAEESRGEWRRAQRGRNMLEYTDRLYSEHAGANPLRNRVNAAQADAAREMLPDFNPTDADFDQYDPSYQHQMRMIQQIPEKGIGKYGPDVQAMRRLESQANQQIARIRHRYGDDPATRDRLIAEIEQNTLANMENALSPDLHTPLSEEAMHASRSFESDRQAAALQQRQQMAQDAAGVGVQAPTQPGPAQSPVAQGAAGIGMQATQPQIPDSAAAVAWQSNPDNDYQHNPVTGNRYPGWQNNPNIGTTPRADQSRSIAQTYSRRQQQGLPGGRTSFTDLGDNRHAPSVGARF